MFRTVVNPRITDFIVKDIPTTLTNYELALFLIQAAPCQSIFHGDYFACGTLADPADLPKVLALTGKKLCGYPCRVERQKPRDPPLTEVKYPGFVIRPVPPETMMRDEELNRLFEGYDCKLQIRRSVDGVTRKRKCFLHFVNLEEAKKFFDDHNFEGYHTVTFQDYQMTIYPFFKPVPNPYDTVPPPSSSTSHSPESKAETQSEPKSETTVEQSKRKNKRKTKRAKQPATASPPDPLGLCICKSDYIPIDAL